MGVSDLLREHEEVTRLVVLHVRRVDVDVRPAVRPLDLVPDSCQNTENITRTENNLWLVRVTLVVAIGFLLQNFGRRRGATNGTLPFNECGFSSGIP